MASKDVSFLSNAKNDKEGMKLMEVIQKQIDTSNQSVECSKCAKEMKVSHYPYVYHYNVGNQNQKITILNAPHYKCEDCGKKEINVFLFADIEKVIEQEIFYRLNNRQDIPDEIDFAEFK